MWLPGIYTCGVNVEWLSSYARNVHGVGSFVRISEECQLVLTCLLEKIGEGVKVARKSGGIDFEARPTGM